MSLLGNVVGSVVRLAGDGASFKLTIGKLLDAHDAGTLSAAGVVEALRDVRAGVDVKIPTPGSAATYLPPATRRRPRGRR